MLDDMGGSCQTTHPVSDNTVHVREHVIPMLSYDEIYEDDFRANTTPVN